MAIKKHRRRLETGLDTADDPVRNFTIPSVIHKVSLGLNPLRQDLVKEDYPADAFEHLHHGGNPETIRRQEQDIDPEERGMAAFDRHQTERSWSIDPGIDYATQGLFKKNDGFTCPICGKPQEDSKGKRIVMRKPPFLRKVCKSHNLDNYDGITEKRRVVR